MSLRIRLLGPPGLTRDGTPLAGPRGRKAWALLAYLLLSRRPQSRSRLAELLFPDANDPLGALRWSLAQLRQALGRRDVLRGDPVSRVFAAGTEIDLLALRVPGPPALEDIEELTGELLEGMTFDATPAFQSWLLVERRHLAATAHALLLERAQADLAAGRSAQAVRAARRLVACSPLLEAHHEALVRSLLASGETDAARDAAVAGDSLLQRERCAVRAGRLRQIVHTAEQPAAVVRGAAAARALLDTGRAAIAAGAVDTGLESLRGACAAAARRGDDYLRARAQLALGSALVHAMRAYGEAAVSLHRAVDLAHRTDACAIAATAHRELGFMDVQAGRRERAESWLALATEEAGDAEEELASIASVRGMNLSDAGRYEEALEFLEESIERAHRCEHRRQAAWSLALTGRVHVLAARYPQARHVLERSLELMDEENWIAVAPLPETLLAHVDLHDRRVDEAGEALEHAFTMACQLRDPCWEGFACRGLALVEAARGRHERALAWLTDGRVRCTRVAHPYQWIHAWLLDALCSLGRRDERVPAWIDELESLASRSGMHELLVRAYLHRARRGDRRARDVAGLLGADLDDPGRSRVL